MASLKRHESARDGYMSSTFIINQDSVWMPPLWTFDVVVDFMIQTIRANGAVSAAEVLEKRVHSMESFLDVSEVDTAVFTEMIRAIRQLEQVLLKGQAQDDLQYLSKSAVSELGVLLCLDSRSTIMPYPRLG